MQETVIRYRAIRRLREYLDKDSLLSVYNALVQPYFNYCCEIWDVFGTTQSNRLQKLHNTAARIITRSSNEVNQKNVLDKLGWQTLDEQRQKAKAKLMFKVLNNQGPKSLTNLFTSKSTETPKYNLRGISSNVCIPKPRTNSLKKSFSYNGAVTWNSLPTDIKESKSVAQFVRKIATYYKQK